MVRTYVHACVPTFYINLFLFLLLFCFVTIFPHIDFLTHSLTHTHTHTYIHTYIHPPTHTHTQTLPSHTHRSILSHRVQTLQQWLLRWATSSSLSSPRMIILSPPLYRLVKKNHFHIYIFMISCFHSFIFILDISNI